MTIRAADLFCGAGGASMGLTQAANDVGLELDLVAINHWPRAVSTHELNHPWARHYCARVEGFDPMRAFPERQAHMIVAGVECTHHSRARGGKPMNDQSRASAWSILPWAEQLQVREILIENVEEFRHWGPLGVRGKPLKSRRGETFEAFLSALRSLGYYVEHEVLNCADYGDPTTRRRLFIRATRSSRIEWPEPTHARQANGLPQWVPAREVIDWRDLGSSIFTRSRPLVERTLARIERGLERFSGPLAPGFVELLHGGDGSLLDRLLEEHSDELAGPFLLPHDQWPGRNGLALVDDVDQPLRTVTAQNGRCNYLVQPFLLPLDGPMRPRG